MHCNLNFKKGQYSSSAEFTQRGRNSSPRFLRLLKNHFLINTRPFVCVTLNWRSRALLAPSGVEFPAIPTLF